VVHVNGNANLSARLWTASSCTQRQCGSPPLSGCKEPGPTHQTTEDPGAQSNKSLQNGIGLGFASPGRYASDGPACSRKMPIKIAGHTSFGTAPPPCTINADLETSKLKTDSRRQGYTHVKKELHKIN